MEGNAPTRDNPPSYKQGLRIYIIWSLEQNHDHVLKGGPRLLIEEKVPFSETCFRDENVLIFGTRNKES